MQPLPAGGAPGSKASDVDAHQGLADEARAPRELEAIEIRLLLEGVFQQYGYDFREYSFASLRRRVVGFAQAEGARTISGLQERVLHDPACMERLVLALSVNVTSMFRDPQFFQALRRRVVPLLRTYPFIRVWHAGCSTGEEVYSMAILLWEEGLYDRCRIYATDMNETVLRQARDGIFPGRSVDEYRANYAAAGGQRTLDEYMTTGYGSAIFRTPLKQQIVFSQHNLALDGSFNEFNLILCRNVMIYFRKSLQSRVHHLLYGSLARGGVLGLGSRESIHLTPHEPEYEVLDVDQKLYRRVGS